MWRAVFLLLRCFFDIAACGEPVMPSCDPDVAHRVIDIGYIPEQEQLEALSLLQLPPWGTLYSSREYFHALTPPISGRDIAVSPAFSDVDADEASMILTSPIR